MRVVSRPILAWLFVACLLPGSADASGAESPAISSIATSASSSDSSAAAASYASSTLSQWAHRAWRTQDGAPPEVVALAQTTDGYLWLGTGVGLFRFDGVRFDEYRSADGAPLPSLNVSALHASADGGLWVGYRFGGISHLVGRVATHYGLTDGLTAAAVYAFAEEPGGVVWAATLGGLHRFDRSAWEHVGQTWNYRGARAYAVLLDRRGTLWADDGDQIVRLQPGTHRFESIGVAVDRAVLREAPNGDLLILDAPRRLRVRASSGAIRTIPDWTTYATPNGMLVSRAGDLWVAGTQGGVHRIRDVGDPSGTTPTIERYGKAQGLNADFTLSILEDREGTFWVGGKVGLDQFRRQNFHPVALPETSVQISIVAARDGDVLVGSQDGTVVRTDGRDIRPVSLGRTAWTGSLTCAMRAPDGSTWVGGPGKLLHLVDGTISRIDIPAAVGSGDVQAIAIGPDGAPWISIVRAGLFRFDRGRWERDGGFSGFPGLNPLVASSDAHGRLWFGYADNRVARLDRGELRVFDERAGIDIGNVTAIGATGGHVWIGGERGLALWKDDGFVRIGGETGARFAAVAALAETPQGELWIAAREGVYRIGATDVAATVADPRRVVVADFFDHTDGLPGVPLQHRPMPSAVTGDDGRLWVATADGLAWTDPADVYRNTVPPPVTIESLTATGTHRLPAVDLRLDAGTRELGIRYTALSLARPERVRFQYRLLGSTTTWSDPSTRREAFFNNLGPGRYRFEVIASNDFGVWNRQAAALDIEIAPFFWQTDWFRLGCVAATLLILYLLYVLRLAQVSQRLQQRVRERFLERERIARDLHDTLLQSVQGLILQFDALTRRDTPTVPRAAIARTLDKAERVLVEGRNRVATLRDSSQPSEDLTAELTRWVSTISEDWVVPCTLRVEGTAREVEPSTLDDLVLIAREALFNAFRHAEATAIDVLLVYRARALELTIADDGRGIPSPVVDAGAATGHYGIPGMRERAERLGTRLLIGPRHPRGTILGVTVQASVAYTRRSFPRWRSPVSRRNRPG